MVNDMTIIYGILIFFVLIGTITPFINDEFDSNLDVYSSTELEGEISTGEAQSSISAFKVIGSIVGVFFWTFGQIPAWLDAIVFIPLRLLFVIIVARNVWIGGGG